VTQPDARQTTENSAVQHTSVRHGGPGGVTPWRGLVVATRPQYLPGAIVLYGIGTLLGEGAAVPWRVAFGIVVVTLVHIVTHYVNDAEDVATDEVTENPTFATGGSRAIQRGLITPAQLMRASAWLSAAVVLACGVLAANGHIAEATVGLAMLGLGYSYSGRPLMLGRRLLGELDAALVMGLLVPLAGALAAGGPSPIFVPIATIFVVQTLLGRLATAYPDLEADRSTQKWTVTAVLGHRWSVVAFVATGVALAALAELVTGSLPSPLTMRLSVWVTAAAALSIAVLIGVGEARGTRGVRVPILAIGSYAISLTAITAALWLRWIGLP
jgi:1,4-dihydroxy-2-naphthoate octaprenyltransferase